MKRISMLFVIVLVASLTLGVHPALADTQPPPCPYSPCVYVDPYRNPAGNEDGSSTSPYNDPKEGYAFAYSRSSGAWIMTKDAQGNWTSYHQAGAYSGAGGLPFPKSTLYLLVAAVALSLLLAGWILQHRSRALLQ